MSAIGKTGRIHLTMLGADPISEGPHGCDYRWIAGYAAYQCRPHRWRPGSDSSYARYQADNDGED